MTPLVVYTGSRVWVGPPQIVAAPAKRMAHGPGLYFTTSLQTARKYAGGSRTVLRVELDPNLTWLEDATAPTLLLANWVMAQRGLTKKREIVADLYELGGGGLPAGMCRVSSLLNLMVNYNAIRGAHGPALARFLVSLGISASHVSRSGSEEWLVLFDPTKVLHTWRRVTDGDPWDLPSVKRTSRP